LAAAHAAGARLPEQPRLGQRLVAAADDDHSFAFHPHEDGECIEFGGATGHFRQAPGFGLELSAKAALLRRHGLAPRHIVGDAFSALQAIGRK
jgi:hypothetical protein